MITGDLVVQHAQGDEDYLTFGGDHEHPSPDEVIFADSAAMPTPADGPTGTAPAPPPVPTPGPRSSWPKHSIRTDKPTASGRSTASVPLSPEWRRQQTTAHRGTAQRTVVTVSVADPIRDCLAMPGAPGGDTGRGTSTRPIRSRQCLQ